MILDILQIIFGIILALFLPGYMIVYLFFKEFDILEKIAFSITFSIMVSMGISIFLGYNEAQAKRFGGLTFQNIVIMETIIISILLLMIIWQKYHLLPENLKIKNIKKKLRKK